MFYCPSELREQSPVTRLWDECRWPEPALPRRVGHGFSFGRLGSVLFFFPWEQVTAAAGSPAPPQVHHTHGLGQLAAAPRTPEACGYQAAGGPSLLAPGCQVLAPLLKGLESGRRKERLFGSLLGPLYLPGQHLCPAGRGDPSVHPSQPASSAPGQMHRLRTDPDLGSYAQSGADKGGGTQGLVPMG